jgi:hypothetical protein
MSSKYILPAVLMPDPDSLPLRSPPSRTSRCAVACGHPGQGQRVAAGDHRGRDEGMIVSVEQGNGSQRHKCRPLRVSAAIRLTVPVSECQKSAASKPSPLGDIIPECRAPSSRNPGRHHLGLPGRLRRNPQVVPMAPVTTLIAPYGARLAHALSRRSLEIAFGTFLLLVAARFNFSLV